MNNNKKILKRSSAAFLAALNIFNFAGGSSKAKNPWNIVEYVETDSKKRKEGKCKLVSELEDFLNLLENVDFEQDVSELIAKENLKRLISVRIRIGKENLERIISMLISMLCTDKECTDKENLERLISARMRNGICLCFGCYYIVNKNGYNVLFFNFNFNDDLIVNEKDFKKSNVLSLLSNLLKFFPSKFDLSESELDILSEPELSFFPELGIRFLWKLYKELSKSKFDTRFVIYKIKENTLAEQLGFKRTLNNRADINFIDADEIDELKAKCKVFKERAENAKNKAVEEKEEAKSDLNEANQELKEKEDKEKELKEKKEDVLNLAYKVEIGEHIETLNKIDELKNDKTKCENEAKTKTNLGELDKTPEASDTLGQHPGNIEQGVDKLNREKNESLNKFNDKLETANSRAKKLGVVAVFGTLVSLGCVFQNELKNACGTAYKKVLELKNSILG